jgi:hypothetical protein
MPDISMCQNTDCPKHKTCWRFNAPRNLQWQAFAEFKPDSEGNCDFYIPMAPKTIKQTISNEKIETPEFYS